MDDSLGAKANIAIELIMGVCIKDLQGRVLSQNEISKNICGNHIGEICKEGCMKDYSVPGESEAVLEAFTKVANLYGGERRCDAVLIHTSSNIVTLLYAKSQQISDEINMFRKFGLTEAEQAIVLLVLDGLSNRDIAKRLFISLSTVKTHINHIYGKLPEKLREKIQASRKK